MSDDQSVRVLRLRKDRKGHETIRREMLQDRRLMFMDRGILATLISMPPDWKTNSRGIADRLGQEPEFRSGPRAGEGRDAVRASMTRLAECGYLIQHKWRKRDGSWQWLLAVDDDPDGLAERFGEFMEALAEDPDVTVDDREYLDDIAAGGTTDCSTGPGENDLEGPAGGTMACSTGAGTTGAGTTGAGTTGHIESSHREIPLPPDETPSRGDTETINDRAAPPVSDGSPRSLCEEHGKTTCRPCNHNTRDAAKAQSARERHEERERSRNCPWCPRTPDDNIRIDRGIPISPPVICDHETPNSVILARIAEQEAAEDGVAPQVNSRSGASSRTGRSDEARAEIARILASKRSAPKGLRSRTAVNRGGRDDETRARIRQETAEREAARVDALGLWPDDVPAESSAESS
jgi:hypothetical protein